MDGILLPLATGTESGSMTQVMEQLVLQLAIVLIAARLGGLVFRRWLKLPDVLGELTAGMVIGPYALGGISFGGLEPLFPPLSGIISVSEPLYGIATIASVLLLFMSGLETNLKLFLRYSVAGVVVGIGGVVFSYSLGAGCGVFFGIASHFIDPGAMFLGIIATATSVGITARILAERQKTDTPEGVTIMAAAVFDDVLGIVMLAIVIGLTQITDAPDHTLWQNVGLVAGKAFGFWLICTTIGILIARRISSAIKTVRSPAAMTSLAFGLALLLSALSERSGLALIIGAYIVGLSLSTTDLAQFLQEQLRGFYDLVVPVFFCVMGMLVDFSLMPSVLVIGLAYTGICILSKVLGCGLPALATGFNLLGATRIGIGMMPRGEVTLIIAGIGLAAGAITPAIFAVAVMMTILTTLVAPPLLIAAFHGKSGIRDQTQQSNGDEAVFKLPFPTEDVAEFVMTRIMHAFAREEFFVHAIHGGQRDYQVRKDLYAVSIRQDGAEIHFEMNRISEHVVRFIVLEELLALEDVIESLRSVKSLQSMGSDVLTGLYR